jgi:hypothetical protein
MDHTQLTKCAMKMKEYNPKDQESIERCKMKGYQEFMACKYQNTVHYCQTQYLQRNYRNPQRIMDPKSIISKNRFDNMNKHYYSMVKNQIINENIVEENPELNVLQFEGQSNSGGKLRHPLTVFDGEQAQTRRSIS